MHSAAQGFDVHGTEHDGVRGIWVRGTTPKELVLSDGSRLGLEPTEDGGVEWRRRDEVEGEAERVSAERAFELAGDYGDYVEVRTRAEAAWMRAVADWYAEAAGRLEDDLSRARA